MFIGIDLGTSAVKVMLVDRNGKIQASTTEKYPLYFPQNGWSEQHPEDWMKAVYKCLDTVLRQTDTQSVKGIGVGGQMHGLVVLDENDNVIRPAILWNDGRTQKQVEYLNKVIGTKKLTQYTANIAFAGFTAPKLLWLKENEPENFGKINKIMLPKDYIVYRLNGVHSCDYSDASGMLLLDVKNKCWSEEMLKICDISESQLPALYESYENVGFVKSDIAQKYGLNNVRVVAGAGDNAAAAIGTGTVFNGKCNISLGTSGTLFIASDHFSADDNNALHSFAHANGKYHLMGCMLNAASCNKWFMNDILNEPDYDLLQNHINKDKLGKNHIYFLPYLMGERSPINDVNARGTFVGLTMDTTREDMVLAVLEGVAFAMRDILEQVKALHINVTSATVCGGGAKSLLWQTVISNILGITLQTLKTEQGPGYGAAILAMVGAGVYESVEQACKKLVFAESEIKPSPELKSLYEEKYQKFKLIYPALKEVFTKIKE